MESNHVNGNCCDDQYHPSAPEKTADLPPLDEEEAIELADLYKLFADSTRLRIIIALLGVEMCVIHLAERIGMSQSAVSHQLRQLRQARLVRCRREGQLAYYSLMDEHVSSMIQLGLEHIREE